MEFSEIGWCDHTYNRWIGCTKWSPGCVNCYAETRDARFAGRIHWGKGASRELTSHAGRRKPLHWNRIASSFRECSRCHHRGHMSESCAQCGGDTIPTRQRVFSASLSDWLDDEVPIEWLADLLQLIHDTPHLDWLLLTKRPENFRERLAAVSASLYTKESDALSGWVNLWYLGRQIPANVWLGATVEDQTRAEQRIPALLRIPARVRFLSCEPLLGRVNLSFVGGDQVQTPYYLRGNFWQVACENHCSFAGLESELVPDPEQTDDEAEREGTRWVCPRCHSDGFLVDRRRGDPAIDWVICGGESGAKARPMHPEWARGLRDQCQAAGVPFFFKQWGEWIPGDHVESLPDHAPKRICKLTLAGRQGNCVSIPVPEQAGMKTVCLVGKKIAGRLLDGREWSEFPRDAARFLGGQDCAFDHFADPSK